MKHDPGWGLFGALFAAIVILPTTTQAQKKSQTGLSGRPIFAEGLKGDFVVTGASTRQFQGAQANSFDLTVAGIPAGATVVKAFADWNFVTDNVNNPLNSQIQFDKNVIQGALQGSGTPDLGWGRKNGASYLSDVTAMVKGNGSYNIGAATDSGTTNGYGEGISLLVIYSDPKATHKQIDVYSGYTSTSSGNGKANLRFFANTDPASNKGSAYEGGTAHFFTNALDGQIQYTNDFYINRRIATNALGTGPLHHSWRGLLGPGAAGMNMYDHAEGDVSGFMHVGDTALNYQTIGYDNGVKSGYSDLVGHSFAAISYQAVPEASTLWTWCIGLLVLWSASLLKRRGNAVQKQIVSSEAGEVQRQGEIS